MKSRIRLFLALPYYAWLLVFVVTPLGLIFYRSFFDHHGRLTLANYLHFFTRPEYLMMTFNSFLVAGSVTFITLLFAYPTAYFLSKSVHKELGLLLIIIPTWINLLLKSYAFIGILSHSGIINQWLSWLGIGPLKLLFTKPAFILAASYIELPFMILPIYNALDDIPISLSEASFDLGATSWQTIRKVLIPLSLPGVRSGIQAVFIPTLSLFMIARLIGGNRIITLGTAIEQHFLTTQNWGMGSAIGVILTLLMFLVMYLTKERPKGGRSL